MSIIVASGEQISKSPLNTSLTKQMYSFPKADSSSNTFYYNLPSVRSNRGTSLGKGEKFDFTREHKDKNAQFYNMPTDFDPKKPHTPSWTFGISRSYYDKVYYETNKMLDKNVPGPGKYQYLKPFGSEAFKFSMLGRKDEKNIERKSKSPGPGEYPIISINPNGKYPVSSMRNATAIVFGLSKEKRFNYSSNKNPGPDQYNINTLINGSGYNYVSKFKSSTAKSLYGRVKDPISKLQVPGPGSYILPSEFGIYESRHAKKENSQSPNKSLSNNN